MADISRPLILATPVQGDFTATVAHSGSETISLTLPALTVPNAPPAFDAVLYSIPIVFCTRDADVGTPIIFYERTGDIPIRFHTDEGRGRGSSTTNTHTLTIPTLVSFDAQAIDP